MIKFIKGKDKFNDLALDFKSYLLIDKKYSNQTISSYMNSLKNFYDYLIENKISFSLIKKVELLNYTKFLKDKGLSVNSINHNISVLKSFFKFLVITKYLYNTSYKV